MPSPTTSMAVAGTSSWWHDVSVIAPTANNANNIFFIFVLFIVLKEITINYPEIIYSAVLYAAKFLNNF
jgi:hypothetical protein